MDAPAPHTDTALAAQALFAAAFGLTGVRRAVLLRLHDGSERSAGSGGAAPPALVDAAIAARRPVHAAGLACVPLLAQDELAGVLYLEHPAGFSARDIDILALLAAQAAIGLRSAALRRLDAGLARALRASTVDELTAAIAHDINQPLMAIASHAGAGLRWLDRDPPRLAQARLALATIAEQSSRAGRVLQSLEAGAPPRAVPVRLHAALREVLALEGPELERHGIALELRLGAPSAWVSADPVQLGQVLRHALANALEALGAGGEGAPRLRVAVRAVEGGMVEAEFTDNGPGPGDIDPEQMFEPFYSTRPGGVGMGLAICRAIVEPLGGNVRAVKRLPRGCSIIFTLPCLAQGAQGQAAEGEADPWNN
ncbi:sensor histidine kinase [Massilia yuzhufengensis]|uniref:histidine kinase n=1 Tax=Massilia yuzhufengensis TaxID=1164594 RepID=A0A1I1E7U9_9BURK|nr:ATP-binding protein [Massilia yuzhufengensis]SFB82712.1 His Kinase A (phospho-acceptor) domain-containing protein [Massilia yuzhufengensis]